MGVQTIKASCPDCGEVSLAPSWVTLRVCANAAWLSEYRFICPVCRVDVSKPVDNVVQRLLTGSGCIETPWRVPDEVLEPHNGPPISYDDVLNMHEALAAGIDYDELRTALKTL